MHHRALRQLLVVVALVAALLSATLTTTAAQTDDGASSRSGGGDDVVLTLLHSNDGESALFETEAPDGQNYGGMAPFARLVRELKRDAVRGRSPVRGAKQVELLLSSGDNYLAGAAFQASLDRGVPYYDAIGMGLIGYDASAIGNHEFDFGPDVFRDFIRSLRGKRRFPFVSANLDFSGEPDLQRLENKGRIADSIVVRARGERFGIVGATTEALATISSPRNVVVEVVAPAVQAEVDSLLDRGVNKIIFISHLQSIQEDLDLLSQLSDIDVAVAGGGDELLANPGDLLVPGDEDSVFGSYPVDATDADGVTVPVVTTSGGYRYVGQLKVVFDRDGEVTDVLDDSGPVRVTTGAENPDAVTPFGPVQRKVVDPVAEFVDDLATTPAGVTEAPLDSRRGVVSANGAITVTTRGERVSETNLGDLATDAYMASATALAPSFGVPTPDLAITNGGGIRRPDDVVFPGATPGSPATVSRLDISDQFPFPNFLTVTEDVSAAQLKATLENGVSRVQFVDGRFAHLSGLTFQWDSTRTPEVRNDMTCAVEQTGDRVTYIAADPGNDGVGVTVLYDESTGGWQVDENATTFAVASIDFLSISGGDCYDLGAGPTTRLGVQYGQVVESFITDDLGGVIGAADYPFEGTDRIQQVG
ncbi:MAG: 5'-nucleotidase C-terminal domain-containing protein [Acidimicrobiia bacterium]|nr:5'-nucleotidase C-terminal domain-containing protein [Acidimicrobiia bacterium]